MKTNNSINHGIFYGWWIVAACMVGLSASPQPFILGTVGLFMKPLEAEFGWSRSEISACVSVFTVTAALCFPLIGRMIDRFGVRKILIPSMIFLAVCLSAISLFVSKIVHLIIVFFLLGLLAAGSNTVGYVPVITSWFNKRRGIAIGLSMSGIGLGFFYVPILVQYLIETQGWRAAYFGLSGVLLLIAVPTVALVIKNTPADMGLAPDGDEQNEVANEYLKVGLDTKETLRTREFWMLTVIFVFISFVLNGLITHLVPMLTDRNMDASYTADIASSVGISVFISRILVGYLVDRFFAPHVAIFFTSVRNIR